MKAKAYDCPSDSFQEEKLRALEAQLASISDSNLPDLAPELYWAVRDRVLQLRRVFDETGSIPEDLQEATWETMGKFDRVTTGAKRALSDAYQMRNSAQQLDFIRAYSPAEFYRAEASYQQALELANQERFQRLESLGEAVTKQYRSLTQNAQRDLARAKQGDLERYRSAVTADLYALDADPRDSAQLRLANGVYARLNLGLQTGGELSDFGDLFDPPYWPPPPPQHGPKPPSSVGFEDRTATSLRFAWVDVSDNETGNRLLRSTDLSSWETVVDVGPVPKFETFAYTDTDLQPDTQYCYRVETYNAEGARQSPFKCATTRDGNGIRVWRLQLRVKVADLPNAGTDHTLLVRVDKNGPLSTDTYLDYGQNDFERGSNFLYDLRFDGIEELGDILGLSIVNAGDDQDDAYISDISLLVNQNEVFRREYGITGDSVFRLGSAGPIVATHGELRSHPSWQAFVSAAVDSPLRGLPPVPNEDGAFQIVIPNAQIVSRIEGLIGHLLHAEDGLGGGLKWGHLSGAAVEVDRINANSVRVDLDLEADFDWWPNPSVDIDFVIAVSKACNDNAGTMTIQLESRDFTSDVDHALWQDILSLGVTEAVADVINWLAENCTSPPQISRSFEVPVPGAISCEDVEISFDTDGNLIICCISP